MATVDCQECSKNFPTFKLYIKHLLTKECKGKQSSVEHTNMESENKRLKVSPKLFQKKKQNEPDSTTTDDQFVVSGDPVYVPVKKGTEPVNMELTTKKTIMQNMHPNKDAEVDKFVSQANIEGHKTMPVKKQIVSQSVSVKPKPASTSSHFKKGVQTSQVKQPIQIPKPGKIPCTLCSKLVKSRGMTQHLNMQHKCKYCSAMVEDVDNHIITLHEREPCEYCNKKFDSEDAVDKHVEVAHLQTCERCDEEFYSEESLNTHIVDIHESEECDICNMKFLIADKIMDKHKEEVHGIKTKTIKQFGGGMMFMMVSD